MKTKTLALSVVLALSAAGGLILILDGEPTQVTIVDDLKASGWAELSDSKSVDALTKSIDESGATGIIECFKLTADNSNMPGKTLCRDNKQAAWIVSEDVQITLLDAPIELQKVDDSILIKTR